MPYALTYPLYDISYVRALKYGALGSEVARAYAELSLLYYNTTPEATDVKQLLETSLEESTLQNELLDLVLSEVATLNMLSVAFKGPGCPLRLPNLRFTQKQLLFITWCYMRCKGNLDSFTLICDAVVRHSPSSRKPSSATLKLFTIQRKNARCFGHHSSGARGQHVVTKGTSVLTRCNFFTRALRCLRDANI
ncbi:hypothetical protein HPB48_012758 [Haemaphysalis longicornis]|uniref:Uncharacterized protein n=1 Tax=Haemaphysalis longicornis TaxID=44386 RepID=A0A9J6GCQ3_HAELO|nr:hypothetical protein HPB48_012758 [Haemaphysalis longicornis]